MIGMSIEMWIDKTMVLPTLESPLTYYVKVSYTIDIHCVHKGHAICLHLISFLMGPFNISLSWVH